MKSVAKISLFLVFIQLITACKKDNDDNPPLEIAPVLNLEMKFKVGTENLVYDTVKYYNLAGNNYSVSTLQFYLSEIALIDNSDNRILIRDYAYIDARRSETLNITISNLSKGCYKGIAFNIGLDSIHNVDNGLPVNADNIAMEWPTVMGGGYHFLKLEGHFIDSSSTPGYAMHLGTNRCLIPIEINQQICLTANNTLSKSLTMDVNEWYQQPEVFDFNIDGNYIMGNMMGMLKFAGNGTDVFEMR